MKLGDFSDLAEHYAKSRPGYSELVLDSLIALQVAGKNELQVCDVGAGTGIWTRMVTTKLSKPVYAVEPNANMLRSGQNPEDNVIWIQGSAESTGLKSDFFHWVTMASSFHWTNLEIALDEFARILKPGGCFTALWNPREISEGSKLNLIEEWINARIKNPRISSGNSEFTSKLENNLTKRKDFHNFVFIEANHTRTISKSNYIETWKSVNDIRVQLGEVEFENLLKFIDKLFEDEELILNNYKTKSWSVFKS
jgi:ubiquinone/menaquinone biosynthesis C-methylase UbiE